jgi:RNA polymerase sigma-70 factor (ECF subfamily)
MLDQSEGSFLASVEPHRGELRVHCYRMLGSSHDGDDVVQETMLRAWRARGSLKDPTLVRPWLYRIATNTCLDELKRRPRRALASDVYPPADPHAAYAPATAEEAWLEPMPDAWLGAADAGDPDARYTLRESVALAFVAALQCLTPSQRATLLLRDVVGLSAEETAEALGIGMGAANSALFRAREAVEQKIGAKRVSPPRADASVDDALLARYLRAFESRDPDAFVALLHEDVQTTMPPTPTWIGGLEANRTFYRNLFASGKTEGVHLVRVGANGQPAFAFYRRPAPGQPYELHALQVLGIRDGKIARVDHFLTKSAFPAFGLASRLER